MRSLALTALFGSFTITTSLFGQSLTEHAAAAAGATIGTAAGKPLGTALGKIFGDVNKTTSNAATPKTKKTVPAKPVAKAEEKAEKAEKAEATSPATRPPAATIVFGAPSGSAGSGGGSSHRGARRREAPIATQEIPPAPIEPVVAAPVVPVVKQPTVDDVASIKVGASASEMRSALGSPESRVSIPGDDGHLLEICQYWANGEPIGTVRLDNGRVTSVQTRN
jgi:hypothetical protein